MKTKTLQLSFYKGLQLQGQQNKIFLCEVPDYFNLKDFSGCSIKDYGVIKDFMDLDVWMINQLPRNIRDLHKYIKDLENSNKKFKQALLEFKNEII